jgi:ribonuclease E
MEGRELADGAWSDEGDAVAGADPHADELEALTEAAERDAAKAEPPAAESRAAKPSAAPEPPPPAPVEDDRPKRTGWWNRRGFL